MGGTLYIVRHCPPEPSIRLYPVVGGMVGKIPLHWGSKAFESAIRDGDILPSKA